MNRTIAITIAIIIIINIINTYVQATLSQMLKLVFTAIEYLQSGQNLSKQTRLDVSARVLTTTIAAEAERSARVMGDGVMSIGSPQTFGSAGRPVKSR
uniref:Uncharacterized protein n=1 Tax=Anopheles atroparvus TaxID=41427 RepID=A0A182JDE2_ANOAO